MYQRIRLISAKFGVEVETKTKEKRQKGTMKWQEDWTRGKYEKREEAKARPENNV